VGIVFIHSLKNYKMNRGAVFLLKMTLASNPWHLLDKILSTSGMPRRREGGEERGQWVRKEI
jgi:hypothetical protein